MAIDLKKGQRVEVGLQKVAVGLGWDPNDGTGAAFDLDASAFMLRNGKIPEEGYFVFYNNLVSADHAVQHMGDALDGVGDGDDETIQVDMSAVDPEVDEIIIVVTIHEYETRRQNFGQVRNSFIRIYDIISGNELCKYELDEDFSVESAIEFGRLYRRNSAWRFEAVGRGYEGGLQYFVDKYVS
ncbi:MAG: TerD family protein [Planctomyces sp.]|nr:TerD family protein [Planctomyces sp.]